MKQTPVTIEPGSAEHGSQNSSDVVTAVPEAGVNRQAFQWFFRIFRVEEAVLGLLLLSFFTTYFFLENAPSAGTLWGAFSYNFYGGGTFAPMLLWATVGTTLILGVAILPVSGNAKLLRNIWGDAKGFRPRAFSTLRGGGGMLRVFIPFIACMGAYEINKKLIPALRGDLLYDMQLAAVDQWLFGDLSAAIVRNFFDQSYWTEFLSWFNLVQLDIHSATYISYVYAAPALAASLYFLNRKAAFARFMAALAITGALAYIGYVLMPVVGPKYVFEDRWLNTGSGALQFMDDIKGRNRDCFPSLHTAWTTLFLITAYKSVRPLFWVYLPVGIGVYIATLYGGYHYVLDIVAGHAVALFAWWAAKPILTWWNIRAGR
ncbi:MAG: phosphatase PAP2 family protein [Planctomycetes bacterium]|nr:phosphatase PAP2 family protein [Planctomycetota bacterium]